MPSIAKQPLLMSFVSSWLVPGRIEMAFTFSRETNMGVAKYKKNSRDSIEEVIYQSGIKVKPKYGPEDLLEVGFDYEHDIPARPVTLSRGAYTRKDTAQGPGPLDSIQGSGALQRPTSVSSF